LNYLESTFNMFLSFENIPKDLIVEDDGIIFDFFKAAMVLWWGEFQD